MTIFPYFPHLGVAYNIILYKVISTLIEREKMKFEKKQTWLTKDGFPIRKTFNYICTVDGKTYKIKHIRSYGNKYSVYVNEEWSFHCPSLKIAKANVIELINHLKGE